MLILDMFKNRVTMTKIKGNFTFTFNHCEQTLTVVFSEIFVMSLFLLMFSLRFPVNVTSVLILSNKYTPWRYTTQH